jgi:hypothetical protein
MDDWYQSSVARHSVRVTNRFISKLKLSGRTRREIRQSQKGNKHIHHDLSSFFHPLRLPSISRSNATVQRAFFRHIRSPRSILHTESLVRPIAHSSNYSHCQVLCSLQQLMVFKVITSAITGGNLLTLPVTPRYGRMATLARRSRVTIVSSDSTLFGKREDSIRANSQGMAGAAYWRSGNSNNRIITTL